MRVTSISLHVCALVTSTLAAAQSGSCPNLGFDQGDLSNWLGGTGSCCPITIQGAAMVPGQHTVMSGTGTDPHTDGAVTVVAPGGGPYSARLGNSDAGAQAERLAYAMQVDADNALFVYRYAVVFEDPAHAPDEQPRFEIRMFDQGGQSIDCGMYNVYSTGGQPGFVTIINQFGETVNYRDWTTVGMDLSAYIGQTVTIEFTTGDCSLGGHYGYAYIDSYCSPLTINAGFCPGLDFATLSAPEGFASYLWSTGETTRTITVGSPALGDVHTCTLTSVTGCTVTLTSVLEHSVVSAGFSIVDDCSNHVVFADSSFALSGPPVSGWHWDFGDGHTSDEQHPIHSFATAGDHTVQLLAWAVPECPDTLTWTITTIPSPQAAFTFEAPCFGLPVELHDSTMSDVPLTGIEWDFGDGSPIATENDPLHHYDLPGIYTVRLVALGGNGCNDTLVQQVPVIPAVYVSLGPDTGTCIGTPILLDAGNSGLQFLWNTGDTTQTLGTTITGNYSVEVTDPAGCLGRDTILVTFDAVPVALLPDTSLCPGMALMLNAANPGASYQWSTGDTTATITVPQQSGMYSVTVTSPNGCSAEFHSTVHYHPAVPVDLGPDQGHCVGDTVVLSVPTVPGATYTWSNGSPANTAVFHQSATVWLTAVLGPCTTADTVHLVFDPEPVIHLKDTTLCASETLVLDAGNPGSSHLWTTGDTSQVVYVQGVSGPIGVTVTSPGGCMASAGMVATFVPDVTVDLGPDQLLCQGDSATLWAGGNDLGYLWSTGGTLPWETFHSTTVATVVATNGHCTGRDTIALTFNPFPGHAPVLEMDTCFEDPRHRVFLHGAPDAAFLEWSTGETTEAIEVNTYGTYWVRSGNLPACITVDTIAVREYCPPRVFVPNAFTPNNDGYNDLFGPAHDNIRVIEFTIYDRQGGRVFVSTGDGWWDGRSAGQEMPVGLYQWRLVYRPVRGDGRLGLEEVVQGHVTLVR
jgi:gliding motility-associated-like protein